MRAALLLLIPALQLAGPPVMDGPFVELRFEPALEKALSEKKLFLVDFSATWCEPCHRMERDTWAAAEVRAWLSENAIAIQVDYDAETALAERFQVTSLPTVLALRDGVEFDRLVGYQGPDPFLVWGRDARAGRKANDALRERSAALRATNDIGGRLALVRELVDANQYDEALEHYLWLWTATRKDPRYSGMRLASLLTDMAALARLAEPARQAFAELHAKLQAELEAAALPSEVVWSEWCAFCEHFAAPERILAWYGEHRDEAGRLRVRGEMEGDAPHHIFDTVFTHLVRAGRLDEAGRLIVDAPARAERLVGRYRTLQALRKEAGDAWSEGAETYTRGALIEDLSALHAVLLFAERRAEATAVGNTLVATFDAPDSRLALVGQAIMLARKTDPNLARWLEEAERRGGNTDKLRRQLARLERDEGR